jgi:hypothetical protein
MKIHPIVGAELLEQVEFPIRLRIMRAHHENGMGSAIGRTRGRTYRSARGFFRRWIAWMPWPRTATTAALCRWPNPGGGQKESGKAFDPQLSRS